ncbi:UPF0575 protein C19orf67 homolog [Brachyhypopomus gauderio]|uniref:UPF0575 protein C19orf67 homolog n=1 Tax=Brachyhypopomus gauderio TaxID=698409 RepID=UPI00404362AC
MDDEMYPIQEQLQYLLVKTDHFREYLLYRQRHVPREGFYHVVSSFLRVCQPLFAYLESMARDFWPDRNPVPPYIRGRMLQFSQQLCIKLEHFMRMLASFRCLSLEESDPFGISYFFIGQCQVACIKVSIFRYCHPTPFSALTSSRLYKRMRWNVEQEVRSEGGGDEKKKEAGTWDMEGEGQAEIWDRLTEGQGHDNTEYFFLCCEDIPVVERRETERGQVDGNVQGHTVMRMWSIGQWVQTYPDPGTDSIYDWVLCRVPQGQYKHLMCLGVEEPSTCFATDRLLEVLILRGFPQEWYNRHHSCS